MTNQGDRACSVAGWPAFDVAHSLPGRIRLRLPREHAARGPTLADALDAHAAVSDVSWTVASRSLVVRFDPARSFADIAPEVDLAAVPRHDRRRAQPEPGWRQLWLPAVSTALALSGSGLAARLAIGVCALPMARRAARSLLAGRLSVDVLDATAVSLLLGTGDVLAGGLTVALVETGELMRRQASGRARRAMSGRIATDARGVRVLRNGSEPRLPVEQVSPGDQVVIYAGETVSVDGEVVSGTGTLDNGTWTGEWRPAALRSGASLLAGSTLLDGRIVVRVAATGDATRAGRLAAAVEDAVAGDTRVADLGRALADRFVLPVLLVGGGTFAVTRDLGRLIAVLISEFGTGFRISVPTSILTTMIVGARSGILFKRGRAIEALAAVDTVVFDKTGTLTEGRPAVVGVATLNGATEEECLRLAGAAEGHLPHPLARAIRRAARRRSLDLPEPDEVRYLPGGGVRALIAGSDVLVGDERFLESHGVPPPRRGRAGSSVAFVARDGRVIGQLRIRDRVKRSAAGTIDRLRAAGIRRLVLATGDHREAARAVADGLGLDECLAEAMPEEKAELVARLRAEGRRVAVVGDGMNDASALARADVGVAMARGADLARETADVTLLTEDLESLVRAVRLSRSAMGRVRENIGIVTVPNAAALSLAVAGRMSPLVATLVNNGATVLAAANGLRPLLDADGRSRSGDSGQAPSPDSNRLRSPSS